ncbi:MAG TPA: beta-propeller fold lactonase family protein [Candidatus Binatia bacterium]|nr:beta-propeller fold lactonase family protein [Candidatus Binatia bacterium]
MSRRRVLGIAMLALLAGAARAARAENPLATLGLEPGDCGGLVGLGGAADVVVSPDGGHVYVGSYGDQAIVAFARNAATGRLTFLQALFDGVGGVDGIERVRDVAISADGSSVYAAGEGGGASAIAVFQRDAGTGLLTFVEAVQDGVGGVTGLAQLEEIAVSADDQNVYGVSRPGTVTVFARNGTTGALTFLEVHRDGVAGVDGLANGVAIMVPPDGAHVYAGSAHPDRAVAIFARNAGDGRLTFSTAVALGSQNETTGIESSADGTRVHVNIYYNAYPLIGLDTFVYDRNPTTGALSFRQRAQRTGTRSMTSADGEFTYFTGDFFAIFDRDPATGTLVFLDYEGNDFEALRGSRGAMSPDGTHLYQIVSGTIAVYRRDATTGGITYVESLRQGPIFPGGMAISPGGEHVYAACAGSNTLVVFARGATGDLTFVERQQDGVAGVEHLDGPTGVAVAPDGGSVYVASRNFGYYGVPSSLVAFSRNPTTGGLAFADAEVDGEGGVIGLDDAQAVAVSPDGAHVYAAGPTLVAFARDAGTSVLTHVQTFIPSGPTGLGAVHAVTVSPDGANVYTSGTGIGVFGRNPTTGVVSLVQVVEATNQPSAVALTPDGTYAYVAGNDLLAFRRDPATGELTLVGTAPATSDFFNPPTIALDAAGARLYVRTQGAVATYRLDAATGRPFLVAATRHLGTFEDGRFIRPPGMVASPDAQQLYAGKHNSSTIARFERQPICPTSPLPGCRHSGSGSLRLTSRGPANGRNRIVWKWLRGDAMLDDFGDPFGTDSYTLCLYDAGATGALVETIVQGDAEQASYMCPECWQTRVADFRFVADGVVDGIQRLLLRAGAVTRARVTLNGGGENFPAPALPLAPPITLQLQASNGECWESTFSTARVNRDDVFKARAD